MTISAAVLAGGAGRRMGGINKALIRIDGRSILSRQLDVLRQVAGEIAIAGGDPAAFAGFGIAILPDASPGAGPLAGIASALAWSPRPRILCVACDMPFLCLDVLAMLAAAATDDVDVVAPIVAGRAQPLCAVYSRECARSVEQRIARGELAASDLLSDRALRVQWIAEEKIRNVDPSLRTFVNVNTPDDLQ